MTRGPLTPVTVRYSAWDIGEKGVSRGVPRGGRVPSCVLMTPETNKICCLLAAGPHRVEAADRSLVAAAACSCTFAKSSERLIAPARASHADPARSLVSRSRAEGPSGRRVTGMINGTRVCVVVAGRHQFKPLGARSRRRHFDETDGMATSGAMDAPAPSVSGKARYIKGATLGEGTFGVVTKAEDTLTRKHVAIKKIRMGKFREGINFTAIREIKLLQELRHPHVIELVDCFPHKRNLNLVFECCSPTSRLSSRTSSSPWAPLRSSPTCR